MKLSNIAIKNAKPKAKPYKLFDGAGLFLQVTPSGGKLWRLKYAYLGKEKLLTLGAYPAVGLKEARTARDKARAMLADDRDPSAEKKRAAAAAMLASETTFAAVAREFIAKRRSEEIKDVTASKAHWYLSLLEPSIGKRPIDQISAPELLQVLKKIEASGRRESAKRTLAFASRVFRYATVTARAKHDVAGGLKGALIAPKVKHFAAILDPKGVGALMRAIDTYNGYPATIWALKLAPHLFVRPGELRQAEWSEIDLENAVWRIPASRMKMGREHVVPLSKQAVAIFTEAKTLTGHGRFVFPALGKPKRPMCENTLNQALRRLGYSGGEMTAHGFRSTASTLLNESGKWSPDAIDRALSHYDANSIRGTYHRGVYWDERVRMAQWWSDYLDSLRVGATVLPFAAIP